MEMNLASVWAKYLSFDSVKFELIFPTIHKFAKNMR